MSNGGLGAWAGAEGTLNETLEWQGSKPDNSPMTAMPTTLGRLMASGLHSFDASVTDWAKADHVAAKKADTSAVLSACMSFMFGHFSNVLSI
jgi:hypothetical protein